MNQINIFCRKKPVALLMAINNNKNKYSSILAKEIDSTYSYVVNTLNLFKEIGLVEFNKEGKTKYIRLTTKGLNLVDVMIKAKNLCDSN
jgi:predicted transcriptional regulator